MRRAARLHDNGAGFLLLEEGDQIGPAQLAPDQGFSGLIHGMDLKDGFGGIKAYHGNGHGGWLLLTGFATPSWHTDAAGAVHPIFRRSSTKARTHDPPGRPPDPGA